MIHYASATCRNGQTLSELTIIVCFRVLVLSLLRVARLFVTSQRKVNRREQCSRDSERVIVCASSSYTHTQTAKR